MNTSRSLLAPVSLGLTADLFCLTRTKKLVSLLSEDSLRYVNASYIVEHSPRQNGAKITAVEPPIKSLFSPLATISISAKPFIPSCFFYKVVMDTIQSGITRCLQNNKTIPSFENGRVLGAKSIEKMGGDAFNQFTLRRRALIKKQNLSIYGEYCDYPTEANKYGDSVVPTYCVMKIQDYEQDEKFTWRLTKLMDILTGIPNAMLAPSSLYKDKFSIYKARRYPGVCAGNFYVNKETETYEYHGLSPYFLRSNWLSKITFGNTELAYRIAQDKELSEKILSEFTSDRLIQLLINFQDKDVMEEGLDRLKVVLSKVPKELVNSMNLADKENLSALMFFSKNKQQFGKMYTPYVSDYNNKIGIRHVIRNKIEDTNKEVVDSFGSFFK